MQNIFLSQHGYVIAISDDTNTYIANALHIEADRRATNPVYQKDSEAARAAERDGISLIYGMADVPDGVYLDLPETREVISMMLGFFPGYRFLYRHQQNYEGEEK